MKKVRSSSFVICISLCIGLGLGFLIRHWTPFPLSETARSFPSHTRKASLNPKDTQKSSSQPPSVGASKTLRKSVHVRTLVSGDTAPYEVRPARIPQELKRFSHGKAKYGLVISIDGVSYDAMRRYGLQLPHFRTFVRRGFVRPMESVFPSVTWIAHASIATGQYARHHGILGNRWLEDFRLLMFPFQADITEPDRIFRTPSLYDLAAQKGWKTAVLNWPATQRAKNITYNLPEVMYSSSLTHRFLSPALKRIVHRSFRMDYRSRRKWSHRYYRSFIGRVMASEKIETDMFVRDLAVRLVHPRRGRRRQALPRLMLLHFLTPDSWMHKYGNSPWVMRWSLEQMDRMIGSVIAAYKRAGIWHKTAAFVTSDHGFSNAKYTFGIRQLLIEAKLSRYRSMVPRNRRREKVMAFLNGHAAFIYVRPSEQASMLPKIIRLLHESRWERCIQGVYTPKEYRKLGLPIPDLHSRYQRKRSRQRGVSQDGMHPGAPSLVALTKSDCVFTRYHRRHGVMKKITKPAYQFGVHGYLPNKRPFWTFLMGQGPGVLRKGPLRKKGYIVDIAPTVAHLMGLRWPKRWSGFGKKRRFKLDGRILKDVLRK